ncbi:MAG: hypothetical protein PGN07_10580 [Aeromicrobium erythreum]
MSEQPEGVTSDGDALEIDVEARIDRANHEQDAELSEEDVRRIEAEREERLDPANRPEGAVVDNTDRDFDPETGRFED